VGAGNHNRSGAEQRARTTAVAILAAAHIGTSGVLVDGTCHRVDLRNVPKSQRESGILFETTKGSAWQRK
jgi:hypothetical protein